MSPDNRGMVAAHEDPRLAFGVDAEQQICHAASVYGAGCLPCAGDACRSPRIIDGRGYGGHRATLLLGMGREP